jgi:predicted small lipoprotein YifL
MNHYFPLTLIALILTISLIFTSCGQKGDLVRPQPKQQPAEKPHLSSKNSS